jgi:hypothetical protein
MEDAMTGNFTDGEIQESIAADFSSRSNVSQTFAQLKARQQIRTASTTANSYLTELRSSGLVKGFREETWAAWRKFKPYTRDSTSK